MSSSTDRSSFAVISRHSKQEKRYYALGQTGGGRYLFVAFTIRGSLLRVISVRDMNRRETRRLCQSRKRNRCLNFDPKTRSANSGPDHDSTEFIDWQAARTPQVSEPETHAPNHFIATSGFHDRGSQDSGEQTGCALPISAKGVSGREAEKRTATRIIMLSVATREPRWACVRGWGTSPLSPLIEEVAVDACLGVRKPYAVREVFGGSQISSSGVSPRTELSREDKSIC